MSGSVLTAQSLEPALDSMSPSLLGPSFFSSGAALSVYTSFSFFKYLFLGLRAQAGEEQREKETET